MSLVTFRSPEHFRAWLAAHHQNVKELLVRCYKVESGQKGLTYRQALDEALCFGWIDGVRRAVDAESFSTRFTTSARTFRANRKAWEYFQTQAPSYRRTSIFWVMEAKREETRARRLAELIACSARGQPIKLLDRRPKQR